MVVQVNRHPIRRRKCRRQRRRQPASETLPAVIVANRTGFIPEGVEYDMANGRLLTGSLSEGSVFEIGPDGQVTEFVNDAELVSSVGIEADEAYGRLFVANADRSVFQGEGQGQAKLGVYDLSTGSRIAMVDLASTVTDPQRMPPILRMMLLSRTMEPRT